MFLIADLKNNRKHNQRVDSPSQKSQNMVAVKIFQISYLWLFILFVCSFKKKKKNTKKLFRSGDHSEVNNIKSCVTEWTFHKQKESVKCVFFHATVPRANHEMVVIFYVCDSITSLRGSERWYFLPPRYLYDCRKQRLLLLLLLLLVSGAATAAAAPSLYVYYIFPPHEFLSF